VREVSVMLEMLNLGFGNAVAAGRVVAIVATDSAPVRRLIDAAAEQHRLIDATKGRKTRAVIVTDSNHVVTSHLTCQKLMHRFGDEALEEDAGRAG
jgi:regulator of extracellular matrix RemA (YlzA/DUF370 family)